MMTKNDDENKLVERETDILYINFACISILPYFSGKF